MKASIYSKHKQFKELLLSLVDISKLVNHQDRAFVIQYAIWIERCEKILREYGLTEASHFSNLKADLFHSKTMKVRNKQKILFQHSLENIQKAQPILYQVFTSYDQKISQATEILENILVLIQENPDFMSISDNNFTRYIEKVWQYIKNNESFNSPVQQLKVLISLTDTKLLLAEKLTSTTQQ